MSLKGLIKRDTRSFAQPSPSARTQGRGMGLSHRPRVKITGRRSISASSSILEGSWDEALFYEKNLDFLRGHLNILAGLRASTHTVLDAWQESKSWFCHRKTPIFVQCF